MHRAIIAASVAAIALQPMATEARNIVISNDDGLTSNVVALYKALKAEGHDVIVSVPCQNQSGMGAAMNFARPLAPLAKSCRSGAAPVGAPGAGAMTRQGLPANDFYYVDGTPVMSMLYGVDVVAKKRWGKRPDLVLSGPNEGQNVGAIILSSGTVSAAQFAAVSGIPAIAFSAGGATVDDKMLAHPASAQVAKRAAELVASLDRNAGAQPMLPAGYALNVNFPDNLNGAAWKASRIGTYNAYRVAFADNMAKEASPEMTAMAKQHGMEIPALPGMSVAMNSAPPTVDQQNDESIVYKTAIAVSAMQAGYAVADLPNGLEKLLPAQPAQ